MPHRSRRSAPKISPAVRPLAYSDSTTSSTPDSRGRFLTICGSNVAARSRGTSISTAPVVSVNTVLTLVPLQILPVPTPGGSCFSYPRCSVISSLSAVSSTVLVSCLSNPSGPVSNRPCSRPRPHQLDRRLLLSGLPSDLLLRHIIQCRHHRTFLAEHRSACQAGNTVKSTAPIPQQIWSPRCRVCHVPGLAAGGNPHPSAIRWSCCAAGGHYRALRS